MNSPYILVLLLVFLFFLACAFHLHDDHKKIKKAMRALGIPSEYKEAMKYLLLAVYNNHPYRYQLGDRAMVEDISVQSPRLYAMILAKLITLSNENHRISDEIQNEYKGLPIMTIINKYGCF